MKVSVVVFSLLVFSVQFAIAQDNGETVFKQACAACHTIGGGRLVGPDLANVQNRQSEEWIMKFIKSSRSVIESGDAYADSLFKEYNQVQMPDQTNLTDDQLKEILAYIVEKSSAPQAEKTSSTAIVGNSDRGRELFVGNIRFANQGAACNSCHNVEMEGYISGGALGKDLTHSITRLSASGVEAMISGLPFPQMKETYETKPVTEQEIADLTAFLITADQQAVDTATSRVAKYFLTGGISGIIILLGLYSIFWIRRKKGPVNFFIFRRQTKSVETFE